MRDVRERIKIGIRKLKTNLRAHSALTICYIKSVWKVHGFFRRCNVSQARFIYVNGNSSIHDTLVITIQFHWLDGVSEHRLFPHSVHLLVVYFCRRPPQYGLSDDDDFREFHL